MFIDLSNLIRGSVIMSSNLILIETVPLAEGASTTISI